MNSKKIIEELIESLEDKKQKRIIELFKENYAPKKLIDEVNKQIEDDLNDA